VAERGPDPALTAAAGRITAVSEDAAMAPYGGAPSRGPRLLRTVSALVVFLVAGGLAWEAFKWLAGDRWRLAALGYEHDPPLRLLQASDRQLPHLWDIAGSFFEPFRRGSEQTLAQFLVDAALYTWREAFIGFVIGAAIGLALASIFVHSRLLERAFVPYVIASQTIPIVALAPIIVVAFGRGLTAVVIIATYLTFFPVTIAAMRGLSSPDPRALELMRSYAASRWEVYRKVRLPASMPYVFTALKVAAGASIVGAIIGEGPGGVPEGLGRAIINYNQNYIVAPERLWATIFAAAVVGVLFFVLVQAAEVVTLRGRRAAAS
jgi:NitT/TauT family transport system permease protein